LQTTQTSKISSGLTACVFCGSGLGTRRAFADDARVLGQLLADDDISLVYGGGSVGLMGVVAQSCLERGGRVTGVIPDFLRALERPVLNLTELVITEDMHGRKMNMWRRADGFIVLPGGVGTLEELLEQLTWEQLGQHDKPIILLNTENYWAPLEAVFRQMRETGFLRKNLDIRYYVAPTPADAVSFLKAHANTQPLPAVPVPPAK
jgi:uncharacterized protein (TIGR00730 family)